MKTTNRNVMILNKRIEEIYNEVYSINESLTTLERKDLIRGFEDGVNELFGKWAAKAMNFKDKLVGGAKQAWSSMVAKGKEYYEKGQQLAGEAWESIKSFAGKVMQGVKDAYNKAVESISNGYQSFKSIVSKAYQDASASITESYNSMKDKAKAFAEACKGIWSDILEESALLIQATKEKLNSMKEGINSWFEKSKADLEKTAVEIKASGIEGMRKISEMGSAAWSKTTKTAAEIGSVAFFICVAPMVGLVQTIKAIPGVYDSAVEMINNFVEKESAEYAALRVKTESLKYIKTFENFKY